MDHHDHAHESSSHSSLTYEATMAMNSTRRHADRIHWEREAAFRDSPYRQLHHQKGLMGTFRVRLLEAADLERSYWSALALGPVKHLGLSTAHGPVSSFCTFTMDFEPHNSNNAVADDGGFVAGDGKRPAVNSNGNNNNKSTRNRMDKPLSQPVVVSPVMPQDSCPVWSDFHFQLPLRKGSMWEDGMRIHLKVRVDEESHVAERLIPGLPKGDDRLLGRGSVDLTSLCLGEKLLGQPQVGVMDAWIPIYYTSKDEEALQQQQHQFASSNVARAVASAKNDDDDDDNGKNGNGLSKTSPSGPTRKEVGRVRVLVSYKPNGLEPQENDIVALESFARRSLRRSSCLPPMPPLMPLTVKERRNNYLLVEYVLPLKRQQQRAALTENGSHHNHNNNNHNQNKACMRIHRNAVFVIERKNLLDGAMGLALLPTDILMSTPLGQKGAEILGPVVNAGKEVLMPATLSVKLVLMAVRTTAMAGMTGIQAAGGAIWNEGASAWTDQNEESRYRSERARATERMTHL